MPSYQSILKWLVIICAVSGCRDDTRALATPLTCNEQLSASDSDSVIGENPQACAVDVRKTAISLIASPEGDHPDPGKQLVQSPNGTYYSANATGFPGVISMWSPSGKYLGTMGAVGNGPGELSPRGALMLFMARNGDLHVRDGGISWNVFANGKSARKFPAGHIPALPGHTAVQDDGTILTAGNCGPSDCIQIYDSVGKLKQQFDSVTAVSVNGRRVPRPIAFVSGDTFWTTSSASAENGYTLELWSSSKGKIRSIHRRGIWFKKHSGRRYASRKSIVTSLHLDSHGRLFVTITGDNELAQNRTDKWSAEQIDKSQDALIEVINPERPGLIATKVFTVFDAKQVWPRRFLGHTDNGYRLLEEKNGLPKIEIVTYAFVRN